MMCRGLSGTTAKSGVKYPQANFAQSHHETQTSVHVRHHVLRAAGSQRLWWWWRGRGDNETGARAGAACAQTRARTACANARADRRHNRHRPPPSHLRRHPSIRHRRHRINPPLPPPPPPPPPRCSCIQTHEDGCLSGQILKPRRWGLPRSTSLTTSALTTSGVWRQSMPTGRTPTSNC